MTEVPGSVTPQVPHVDISEAALITLVSTAVRTCYGVVGIGRNRGRSLRGRMVPSFRRSAIVIVQEADAVVVQIPVILEYGLPVVTVARNVVQVVSFQLQQALGALETRIEVTVTGLRHAPQSGGPGS